MDDGRVEGSALVCENPIGNWTIRRQTPRMNANGFVVPDHGWARILRETVVRFPGGGRVWLRRRTPTHFSEIRVHWRLLPGHPREPRIKPRTRILCLALSSVFIRDIRGQTHVPCHIGCVSADLANILIRGLIRSGCGVSVSDTFRRRIRPGMNAK